MNYIDVIDAGKFLDAPETDIFALPLVAIALGINRNKMCKIPVKRLIIEKRGFYKKGDILDWALTTEGKNLLNELRNQNSKIKKLSKIRSNFYDNYYSRPYGSEYRPSKISGETKTDTYHRLRREWGDSPVASMSIAKLRTTIKGQLETCDDDTKLEELVSIAWGMRDQFVRLRLGLPRGIELGNWWFAGSLIEVKQARLNSQINYLLNELNHVETYRLPYSIYSFRPDFDPDKEIEAIKEELAECRANLNEIS